MDEPTPAPDGHADRARAVDLRRLRTWVLRALGLLAVALAGSAVGAALAPPVTTHVGPFEAQVRVRPSLDPGVKVLLPPAGEVSFATHWTPVAVEARIATVDLAGARALIDSPAALESLETTAPEELRQAAAEAALWSAGCSLLGAGLLAVLVYRTRWRRIGVVAGTVTVLLVSLTASTVVSFAPDRFAQPQFSGLLSQAPYVAVQAGSLLQRLQNYRAGVASIVQAVTTLYAMSGRLPVVDPNQDNEIVTVLHVSDLHLSPLGFDLTQRLVRDFNVNLVVDTGDITTWGTDVESSTLSWIRQVDVPYVFVRGNHDSRRTEAVIARNPNAVVLDGAVAEVEGVVIAGIGDPLFTPDGAASVTRSAVTQRASASPSGSGAASIEASQPVSSVPVPGPSPSLPPTNDVASPSDPQVIAGLRLADTITAWNEQNPDRPVTIAAVHEPYAVPPLYGHVPLVLTGHFHSRDVTTDVSGTTVMREGTTGGAGISADFGAILEGEPLPLSATLLYFARSGPRAGQVLAYDEVTVGGFGLASATVKRTVLREPPPDDEGAGQVVPSPGPSSSDG